ncbi:MAG: hypothetical protein R2853_12350 [Thermomicrobiales bacterium]
MPPPFPRRLDGSGAGGDFGRILEMLQGVFGPATREALSVLQYAHPPWRDPNAGLRLQVGAQPLGTPDIERL